MSCLRRGGYSGPEDVKPPTKQQVPSMRPKNGYTRKEEVSGPRIILENGSSWPDPKRAKGLEWDLRYKEAPLTKPERMVIAGIVSAYVALATEPRFRGVPPMIRRAAKAEEER